MAPPQMNLKMKSSKTIKPATGFFPFLKLALELRIMIYELLVSYDHIYEFVEKIQEIKLWNSTTDYNRRQIAINPYNCETGRKHRAFNFTPAILLTNDQIREEALYVLAKKPLVLRNPLPHTLRYFRLTMAHIIPRKFLNNVKRIHVEEPDDSKLELLASILYHGGKLTADINNGKITRGKFYPGILKLETQTAGTPLEITFKNFWGLETKVLDLGDANAKQDLIELFADGSYDCVTLKALVEKYGKPVRT